MIIFCTFAFIKQTIHPSETFMTRLFLFIMTLLATATAMAQDDDYQAGLRAYDNGDNAEALTLLDRAINAYEQQGDTFRAEYAFALNHKASALYRLGKPREAITHGEHALSLIQRLYGTSHIDYAQQCVSLATYYYDCSEYGMSTSYENFAIRSYARLGQDYLHEKGFARLRVMGEEAEAEGIQLNYGGHVSINMPEVFDTDVSRQWDGGTDLAYLRTRRSIVDRMEASGDSTSLAYLHAVDSLALAYIAVRDSSRAFAWICYGGPKKNELCGDKSVEAARSYYIYALATLQFDNPVDAKDQARTVMNILDGADEKDDHLYLDALMLECSSFLHYGILGSAIKDAERALHMADSLFGKDSREYDKARFLYTQVQYRENSQLDSRASEEVIDLSRQCYQWRQAHLGAEHPETVNALLALAHYLARPSKDMDSEKRRACNEEAERLYGRFYDLQTSNVRNNFIGMTLDEQHRYWNFFNHYYQELIPFCALQRITPNGASSTPSAVSYNAALLSKGILLNSENLMREALQEQKNGKGKELYEEIQHDKLVLKQQLQLPEAQRTIPIDALYRSINTKQQQLAGMLQSYKDYTQALVTDWKDVQKNLGADDAAVEFVKVRKVEQEITYVYDKDKTFHLWQSGTRDEDVYAAILLTRQMKEPLLLRLFDMNDIGDLYFGGSLRDEYFAHLLWKPILKQLGDGIKNIYFSPVGKLHGMPIESLGHWSGSGYVSDRVNLYRLSSTRELATHRKATGKDGVVYGGLIYSASTGELAADARSYTLTRGEETTVHDPFSFDDGRGTKQTRLPYLTGTKEEADKVSALLAGSGSSMMKVETLEGKKGTEASFKALSGQKKRLIHIGTHGFYYAPNRYTPGEGMTQEDMAMICSGLFMAGADNKIRGLQIPEGVDDGVLTSEEIATLDLRGLDLVTLSACQTGQGTVTGDGVFGLQRGFKKAGASSILMSLWSVDDAATTHLMTEFYRHWKDNMSKHDALERAKAAVRSQPQWQEPRYWAAFVLLDGLER